MDGDGRSDRVYSDADARVVRVVTATGTSTQLDVGSARPVALFLGAADADSDGRDELFIDPANGVYVKLVVFVNCRLSFVKNAQGEDYSFRVDSGDDDGDPSDGDGVGCVDVDADGRLELVGLHFVRSPGGSVAWTRTVVRLEGARAVNGRVDRGVYASPRDDARIALLGRVTLWRQGPQLGQGTDVVSGQAALNSRCRQGGSPGRPV